MKSKIFLGIFIIVAVILSASIVAAVDFNGTEVDEIEDHRFSESDMKKINREYEVYEVDANSTLKTYVIGKDTGSPYMHDYDILIKNKTYHEDQYNREISGYKYIVSSKDRDLVIGYNILDIAHEDPYTQNYKNVCVILHGYSIINTDEPVYKTVTIKSDKKVLDHYNKVPHYKKFKSWDFAKSPKKLKKMIKSRCYNDVFECCALGTTKLVKFYQKQLYKNGAKLVKFKIKRLSKYKYSPQHGYKVAKFKFSVKVKYYTLKPVYKTVTVKSTSNVFSHYKKIGEIW